MNTWRALLQVSRPVSWVNTGLPFLAAAFEVERGLTPAIVLGTLYFLGPYNLLLYGINDIYDYASDVANPRKGSVEGGLVPPEQARLTQLAIAATNLPPLVLLVLLAGATAGLALAIAVAAAIVYSAPPIRTKERPVLDSFTSALHFVLPAICGFLVAGRAIPELPWLVLLAFTIWAMASHALGAIQDIRADRAAGIASIATAAGARVTAIAALLGYFIAAALVATLGPMGGLAALGLDLYLLLPAMVLTAPRDDEAAQEAAARRAWRGFLGLAYLVGFWLTQLLLRSWGITTYEPLDLLIWAAGLVAGWMLLNILATRIATRRRRPRSQHDDWDAEVPSLTIIVPCRDEADRLPGCLASLREQTYADSTILVVDDGSTDGSAAVAKDLLRHAGRVLVAPPKPDGWAGKSWACQVGADAATTDLLLFVDADTVLVPVATRILVEQLQTGRADLLSGVTTYAMLSGEERAAVPGFATLLFGFVPVWLSALTHGRPARTAFAYGPLMLVRREAYLGSGGHAATPDSHREDIDLARTFGRAGKRVVTVHAADLGATRHYPTMRAAIDAWRRILLPYAGDSLALALLTIVVELLVSVVPLLLPFIAILSGADLRTIVASGIPLLLLAAARLLLTLTQRQSPLTILWHPVTVAITVIGQLGAVVDHVTGRRPRWRGRDQPIPDGPSSEASV